MSEITKLCKDCKFFRRGRWWRDMFDRCRHPNSVEWPLDATVRGRSPRHQWCEAMRRTSGECGPDAKLWELK